MRERLIACVAVAVVALAPLIVRAATPANGTISPANPKVTWSGGPLPGTARGSLVQGVNKDDFALKIDVPASYYATHPLAAVRVKATFGASDDLDITVADKAGLWSRASTSRGGDFDQVTLVRPVAGDYVASMRPFKPLAGTYEASAELIDLPSAARFAAASTTTGTGFQPNTIVDLPYTDAAGKHASDNTGEPNVQVDSKGHIFVTAPGNGVIVWRSNDGGATFTKTGDFDADFGTPAVGPVGANGLGGGDADIAIDRNDKVYIADLAIVSINVLRSDDGGATFPQRAITGYEADRQWLATYGDNTVYLGYHDFVGEEEIVFRSDDGGKTFTNVSAVETDPAQQKAHVDCAENTFSGPVAVDQNDETLYIVYGCSNTQSNLAGRTPPYGPANQMFVGVSHDRGATWTDHTVVSYPPGANIANLFPSMALDRAGNAYVTWSKADTEGGASDVYVAYSKDKGATWSDPIKVTKTPGTRMFPWVTGGDAGRIDVAFATTPATSSDDLNAVWNIDLAQSTNILSGAPTFNEAQASDHPIHTGQICASGILCTVGGDRSLLDFIQVEPDPQGYANIVWTENGTGPRHVGFARQVTGTSLNAPVVQGKTIGRPVAKPRPRGALPATGGEQPFALAAVLLAMAAAIAGRMRTSARAR